MKTYVINLRDSADRLRAASATLKQHALEFDRIEAIDGRHTPVDRFPEYNHRKALRRHNKTLSGGEVACYLSHLKALRTFLDSGEKLCIVLEDDATAGGNLGNQLAELRSKLQHLDKWDVVNLTERRNTWMRPIDRISENELRRAYYFPMLATGNFWSQEGAAAFLDSKYGKEVSGPFDTELRSFCAARGRGLSLKTPIIRPSGAPSDIDGGTTKDISNKRSSGHRTLSSAISRHWPDHVCAAFHYLAAKR